MDEVIEDLTPDESPQNKEEPWCRFCHAYTDYRRKWDACGRADLDGRSYSEIIEVPHCIECDRSMMLISTSRKLAWFVNLLALLTWFVGLLSVIMIFEYSFGSCIGLIILGCICYLFSHLPKKSRLTLISWKKAKKEEAIKDLLQKI
jgi:hypothetical protein